MSVPQPHVRHFRTEAEHDRATAEITLQLKAFGDACRMAATSRTDSGRHIEQIVRDFFAFDIRQGPPPEGLVVELARLSLDLTWDETIMVYCGGIVRVYVFHEAR